VSRSFHVGVESSASVERVLAAFGDEAYWRARLATFGNGTATLDALKVDATNTVTVAITLNLLTDRLPRVITQLSRGDLEMVRSERWSLTADGRVHGDLTATMPGAPLSMVGEGLITPADRGSRLDYAASVDVRVPLVGGKIESFIAGQAGKEIAAIQRFTTDWIAADR
jgi:Protein of unknown function (DUF2505)